MKTIRGGGDWISFMLNDYYFFPIVVENQLEEF